MAASLRCQTLHKFGRITWQNLFSRHGSSATGAIFIMVPQVPPDTMETNPIMRYKEVPKFSEMTANNLLTGCSKIALNFDVDTKNFIEYLEDERNGGKTLDGNEVFDRLEDIVAPIDCASNLMTVLEICDLQRFPSSLSNRVQTQMSRSLMLRFNALAANLDSIDMTNLSEDKKRLFRWYERFMETEGFNMTLNNRQDLFAYRSTLLMKEREFSAKVQLQRVKWQCILKETERDVVMLLPPTVRKSIAYDKRNYDQGPWRLCMLESVYKHFMETCPRRDLRENFWLGRHLLCNEDDADTRHLTNETIDTIMDYRDNIALKQGYKNYAEFRMVDTMAGSVENVFVFLNRCREHFLPMAKKELDDLQNFATSKTMYLDLELWDIAFYRRLHAQDLYNHVSQGGDAAVLITSSESSHFLPTRLKKNILDQTRVNKYDKLPYFTLDNVLSTVMGLSEQLFQLKFSKHDPGEIESVNEEVFIYTCQDANSGEVLGQIHIDPFKATPFKVVYNGAVLARGASERLGITPITFVLTNFHRGQTGGPCLISFSEVRELFHQFGSSLQKLLARGDHLEMSGWKCMDVDMVKMVGFLYEQFAQLPHVIEDMSAHHQSGEKLSNTAIKNLIKCQKHMIAFDMCCLLYESAYDIELHTGSAVKKPFREVFEEMYKLFMPTLPNPFDSRWSSEELLFGTGNNACSYYTNIWSQMIAANVYEEFELAGFENKDKIEKIGKKFRDTFLTRANHDSSALFREFKGMDPSYECLFELFPMPAEK